MRKFNFEEIKEFLAQQSDESKIYIGCDSVSYKRGGKWYADYYKVVVVHIDGCRGCKIFGEIETEVDYNTNKKKPTFRLMNECYKVSELFLHLAKITDKDIEVHLDLNPKKKYASNLVVEQAIGYIKGTCNVVPFVKPNAFAASYAADRLLRVKSI
jgi:uncharacterized protein